MRLVDCRIVFLLRAIAHKSLCSRHCPDGEYLILIPTRHFRTLSALHVAVVPSSDANSLPLISVKLAIILDRGTFWSSLTLSQHIAAALNYCGRTAAADAHFDFRLRKGRMNNEAGKL